MEDLEKIIRNVSERRRKRNLVGATLISLSLIMMELAVLIFLGIILVNPIVAVILVFIAPISMAIGLYMILTQPPIILESESS